MTVVQALQVSRCKTDLGLILDAIASDIEFGGNFNLVEGVKTYLGQNDVILHVRLQLLQSAYAHERLAFYAKQAITGDLTTDNTDSIIIGDWGITQDPGNCANVQTAIDSLIDLANSILAPSGDRYRDAADLLHFNKTFIQMKQLSSLMQTSHTSLDLHLIAPSSILVVRQMAESTAWMTSKISLTVLLLTC